VRYRAGGERVEYVARATSRQHDPRMPASPTRAGRPLPSSQAIYPSPFHPSAHEPSSSLPAAARIWYRRLGTSHSSFRYVDDAGKLVRDPRIIARIDRLRVPPGWRDVHVARSPSRAIQAWGFDVRDRKQYRYHDRAVERRDLRKYHRMRALAKEIPRIRGQLRADASSPRLTRDAVAAIVLRLISETFCRVGGERYLRENGTYGITTLRKSHLKAYDRGLAIAYRGKGALAQRQVILDRDLVRLLRRLQRSPGIRLFRYATAGTWSNLTAHDVNRYARETIGGGYSAKDFRTWGGSLRAAIILAELGPPSSPTDAKRNVALAMRLVGAELGNTPTVARKAYVHPLIIARYIDEGEVIPIRPRKHRGPWTPEPFHLHSSDERAFIRFLDRHFPDRRKRRRAGT
jgi:DNA topoisomerase-1